MKSGARTPDAYNHLLNNTVKRTVTKDPSMMRFDKKLRIGLQKQMDIPSFYSFDVVEKTRLLVNEKEEKYKTFFQMTLFFVCKATKVQKRQNYCVSIENVENPNSPHNLLLAVMYDGQDDDTDLKRYADDDMWNQLKTVTFVAKGGNTVTRTVKKKLIAPIRVMCARKKWSTSGSKAEYLEKVDFNDGAPMRTLASYKSDSKTGDNSVKLNSEVLCLVEPEDVVIPSVYLMQGTFQRYFENYINGELNSVDRKDDTVSKTLKEHKKNLTQMMKQENLEKKQYETLLSSKEEAYTAVTAYNLINQNRLNHLKTPEALCATPVCIVNHLQNRKPDEWIQCNTCKEYFHVACVGMFSPSIRNSIKSLKKWLCTVCQRWSEDDYKKAASNSLTSLTAEVQTSFNKLMSKRGLIWTHSSRNQLEPAGRNSNTSYLQLDVMCVRGTRHSEETKSELYSEIPTSTPFLTSSATRHRTIE
uniref:PHD domain-containing protein n=1 Tax=Caenorhabditis tropicalis TaxID=1561998 RepID=A0A1I7UUI6_9PELO